MLYPLKSIYAETFIIESLPRSNFNDFASGIYCFFWTNSQYLYFFLILNFILILKIFQNFWTIALFLFFYITEVSHTTVSNYKLIFLNFNNYGFNSFLTNNLNKYHPFLFYTSVWVILLVIKYQYWALFKFNQFIFDFELFLIFKTRILFITYFINIFSLFLGAWWALQEGTWGGWWNWDPSENFGLLFSIYVVFFIHRFFKVTFFYKLIFSSFSIFNYIAFYYFLFQLSFDLTSHNFGIKSFFFFNNNVFFIEISLLLLIIQYFFFSFFYLFNFNLFSYYRGKLQNFFNFFYIFRFFFSGSIIFLTIAFLLPSVSNLFSFFFWNFSFFNILNSISGTAIISTLWALILLLLFTKIFFPNFNYIILLWCFNNIFFFYIITTLFFMFNFYTLFHFLVLNFFLTNILHLKLSFIFWSSKKLSYLFCNFSQALNFLYLSYDMNFLDYGYLSFSFYQAQITCSPAYFLNYFYNVSFLPFSCLFNFFNAVLINSPIFTLLIYIESGYTSFLLFWFAIHFLFLARYILFAKQNIFYP